MEDFGHTLDMFHEHDFESIVVRVAHAHVYMTMHPLIVYKYRYVYATSTTNSKSCPRNVINVQRITKIFQALLLCLVSHT